MAATPPTSTSDSSVPSPASSSLSLDSGSERTETTSSRFIKFIDIVKPALKIVKTVSTTVLVLAPLGVALGRLLIVLDAVEQADDAKEDFEAIALKIKFMAELFEKYQSPPSNSLEKEDINRMVTKISRLNNDLEEKRKRNPLKRLWLASADMKEVTRHLRIVEDAVDASFMTISVKELEKLDELRQLVESLEEGMEQSLDKMLRETLSPVTLARHNTMEIPSCLLGTRKDLLESVYAWAAQEPGDSAPRVFFLSGVAGSGKSTVAKSVCATLQSIGRLGASFFCSRRSTAEQRNVKSICPTLAYLLSLHSPEFARELNKALALKVNTLAANAVIEEQFRVLIATPAKAAFTTPDAAPIMVIDAVDECDVIDATTYDFLHIILREAPQLHLKFFVTSRPEPCIRDALEKPGARVLRLQEINPDVVGRDIHRYLTAELSRFVPSPGDLEVLASRSQGLFIYASTACKYIKEAKGNWANRLRKLVDPRAGSLTSINDMYDHILKQALDDSDEEEIELTRRCVHAIICLQDSLPVSGFAELLNLQPGHVRTALTSLHSVVDVPDSDDGLLTTYHASFTDYLTTNPRCPEDWAVDSKATHEDLFNECFRIMETRLYFNVSGYRTSYASNNSKERLTAYQWLMGLQVARARNTKQSPGRTLPAYLVYACQRWIDH